MTNLPSYLTDDFDGSYKRDQTLLQDVQVSLWPADDRRLLTAVYVSNDNTNLAESEAVDLMDYYASGHSYMYFGSVDRWAGAKFYRSAIADSFTVDWEYYNGSWAELTVSSNGPFDQQSLSFDPPRDWIATRLWGTECFFVRAKLDPADASKSLPLTNGPFNDRLQIYPSMHLAQSDNLYEGIKIQVELSPAHTWTNWRFALYRDEQLLVGFNSKEPSTSLSFIDTKVRRGQETAYVIEVLNLSGSSNLHQVSRYERLTDPAGLILLPQAPPPEPTNLQVQIDDHGSPWGKATVGWEYLENYDRTRMPAEFELSTDPAMEIKPASFPYIPGKLTYEHEVEFANFLQVDDQLTPSGIAGPASYQGPVSSGELLTGLTFAETLSILQEAFRFPCPLTSGITSTDAEEWRIQTNTQSDLYILVSPELPDAYVPGWLAEYDEITGHGIILDLGASSYEPRVYRKQLAAGTHSLPGLFYNSAIYGGLTFRYIPLFVGDPVQTKSVTWSLVAKPNQGTASEAATDATDIQKYFSLPAPRVRLSNVVVDRDVYSYTVEVDVPDYDDVDRPVNGFVIYPTSSTKYADRTVIKTNSRSFSFVDSAFVDVRPSYKITSYVETVAGSISESSPASLTVTDSDVTVSDPAAGANVGLVNPTKLGSPGIAVYFGGLAFKEWVEYEITRITNPTVVCSATPYDEDPTSTTPTAPTAYMWFNGSVRTFSIYTGVWQTVQDYIDNTPELAEAKNELPMLIKVSSTDSTTGLVTDSFYELQGADFITLSEAFVDRVYDAAGITGDPPEVITNSDDLQALDALVSKTYGQYGLTDTLYGGPAIVSIPDVQTIQPIGFAGTTLNSSSFRIGGQSIKYGYGTDIQTVYDMVGAINDVAGYYAVALIESPLCGGELVIELQPLIMTAQLPTDYQTDHPDWPAPSSLYESYVSGSGYYEGKIEERWADMVAQGEPDLVSIEADEDADTFVQYHSDGAYLIYASRLAVKYEDNTRIQLMQPRDAGPAEPWYGRINTGRFVVNDRPNYRTYSVTEYPMQDWSPVYGAPYIDVYFEHAVLLDDRTIRVANSPLHVVGRNFDLVVEDKASGSLIEDWDERNGLFFLSQPIKLGSRVLVSYTYSERSYVCKELNLNPHKRFGNQLLGKYVGVFIVDVDNEALSSLPETNIYGRAKSIYLRTFDSLDSLYEFNTGARSVRSWPAIEVVSAGGTVVGQPENVEQQPLLLGYYYINPTSVDEMTIQDARVDGGGLRSMSFEEAVSTNRWSAGWWDIGPLDGRMFGSMVAIVRLPQYLLDTLDETRIEREVRSHVPAGMMLLIDYYADITGSAGETVWPLENDYA